MHWTCWTVRSSGQHDRDRHCRRRASASARLIDSLEARRSSRARPEPLGFEADWVSPFQQGQEFVPHRSGKHRLQVLQRSTRR